MNTRDNSTAHPSTKYDDNVRKSIPYYDCFHEETLRLVATIHPEPRTWVDVGCGTGTLVEKALGAFLQTKFFLADPSAAMLEVAARKLQAEKRVRILDPISAESLQIPEPVDVLTAIQALHYVSREGRRQSVANCFRQLNDGGVFVTFENILPLTRKGTEIGKAYWKDFEVRAGKTDTEALEHVRRLGTEFFPITIEDHLALLRASGFEVVELLWYSYVQAGFYCIK